MNGTGDELQHPVGLGAGRGHGLQVLPIIPVSQTFF